MGNGMRSSIFFRAVKGGVCAAALCASSAASAATDTLGTIFYSPAERAAIVAQRKAESGEIGGESADTTIHTVSGFIKREGGNSVAWINGRPVAEKQQDGDAPTIKVYRDGVKIDGKPAKVGETLDALSGERASALPPDAVKVNK